MAGRFVVTDPLAPAAVVDPAIGELAGSIMTAAIARTPVDSAAADPGELRDAWRTERTADGWLVINDADYAMFVEFGSIHNPEPVAMLGQAIEDNRGRRL